MITTTTCPICGSRVKCDCLTDEQQGLLSAAYKLLNRVDSGDTHTNGSTQGIMSAPRWAVDGAAERIGGPFELDVAALPDNAKAPRFFTPPGVGGGNGQDGLKQRWNAKRIWCNPPYHKDYLSQWVEKAYKTAKRESIVVCMLPCWPGSDWFHFVIQGKLLFLHGGSGLDTGRFAVNYILVFFGLEADWRIGQLSRANGAELF